MQRWKKGLLVGIFSSMLWEQEAVEAAMGYDRHYLEEQFGESAATAPETSVTPYAVLNRPVLQATTPQATTTTLAVAEQATADMAAFIPKSDVTEVHDEASRVLLDQLEIHESDVISPAAFEEQRPHQALPDALASRGSWTPITPVQDQAVRAPAQTKQQRYSNPAPTILKKSGATSTVKGQVVTFALRYQGSPYKFGGTSPSGFDCSGFIQYVMNQAGIDVPRTTYQQFAAGTQVSKANLQPGDIVFFAGDGPTSHSGIYMGNGQFVHSELTHGVNIDNLNEGYWAGVYQAGVRM